MSLSTLHPKQRAADVEAACEGKDQIFVMCRRGIFSRSAVLKGSGSRGREEGVRA